MTPSYTDVICQYNGPDKQVTRRCANSPGRDQIPNRRLLMSSRLSRYELMHGGPPSKPSGPDHISFKTAVKVQWATEQGLRPGQSKKVPCDYCGIEGIVYWHYGAGGAYKATGVYFIETRFGPMMQWDHITPSARGGLGTIDNLAVACPHCNTSKAAWSLPKWAIRLHASRSHPRSEQIIDRIAPCLHLVPRPTQPDWSRLDNLKRKCS